jgi:hypothetical protein
VKKRDWTDAEFEVIDPPRISRRGEPWNGIGLPPEWEEMSLLEKAIYVVVFTGLMTVIIWGARAFVKAYVNL